LQSCFIEPDTTSGPDDDVHVPAAAGDLERDNTTLVYSISESAYTDRAEELRRAVERAKDDLAKNFALKHRVLTPRGDTEVGSLLRRRLFATTDGGPTESLAVAVIAGAGKAEFTAWVAAYRGVRSAVVDRSG
jgi:hypothetical protein